LFFVNLLGTLLGGRGILEHNPWRATTLEWRAVAHVRDDDFAGLQPVVYRGAYVFDEASALQDFIPQDATPQKVTPQQIAKGR